MDKINGKGLAMIEKNQTWNLVKRPQETKVIGVKWWLGKRSNLDDSVNKHKARLEVETYAQVWGIHCLKNFCSNNSKVYNKNAFG